MAARQRAAAVPQPLSNPGNDSETVTYMILTAAGVLGLGAFGYFIVAPAMSAYGRVWEKGAAGVLTLFILAAFVGTGITAGLVIVYYWDSIIGSSTSRSRPSRQRSTALIRALPGPPGPRIQERDRLQSPI